MSYLIQQSLRELQVEHIDLVLLHGACEACVAGERAGTMQVGSRRSAWARPCFRLLSLSIERQREWIEKQSKEIDSGRNAGGVGRPPRGEAKGLGSRDRRRVHGAARHIVTIRRVPLRTVKTS